MHARRNWSVLGVLVAVMLGLLPLSLLAARRGQPCPGPLPKVSFGDQGQTRPDSTPTHTKTAHTGGGTTEVTQPRDDTLLITMTGVVTAGPHPFEASSAAMDFSLNQEFAVDFFDPKVKAAKLTVKAQVIGLLRAATSTAAAPMSARALWPSPSRATASCRCRWRGMGSAAKTTGRSPITGARLPFPCCRAPTICCKPSTSAAAHVQSICGKAAAAEFAPDPALDPTWISTPDPFRGANKKEFGFRVTLQVEPE